MAIVEIWVRFVKEYVRNDGVLQELSDYTHIAVRWVFEHGRMLLVVRVQEFFVQQFLPLGTHSDYLLDTLLVDVADGLDLFLLRLKRQVEQVCRNTCDAKSEQPALPVVLFALGNL